MGPDGIVKPSYPGQASLNRALAALLLQYNNILADAGPDVDDMNINSLVKKLRGQTTHGSSFSSYMLHRIEQLKKEARYSYAESYQVTIDHLVTHTKRDDIGFKEITVPFLSDFKGYLTGVRKLRVNSVRIYLNNLRSVYYHAIDNEIIKGDITPFRKFKIEQEKTRPRPISIDQIRQLRDIYPKVTRQQRMALDVFFLIFYLIGINMKDLLYLKPADLVDGRIRYDRFKTGSKYSIKVFSAAEEIINRYRGEKYLLKFMDRKERISPGRKEEAHHDILSQVNKLLKTIKTKHELPFHLSTYTPRYTWATLAAEIGISVDIISYALGHNMRNETTMIYIDFNLAKVDKANEKVIASLKK